MNETILIGRIESNGNNFVPFHINHPGAAIIMKPTNATTNVQMLVVSNNEVNEAITSEIPAIGITRQ